MVSLLVFLTADYLHEGYNSKTGDLPSIGGCFSWNVTRIYAALTKFKKNKENSEWLDRQVRYGFESHLTSSSFKSRSSKMLVESILKQNEYKSNY